MRREPFFEALRETRRDHRIDPDEDDLRPLGAPPPFARARLAARFVFAAAIIAGLAFVAREKAASAKAPGPLPRTWTEPQPGPGLSAARPANAATPLLALEAADPPAQGEPPRWNAATGLREDALTQGGFDAIEAPFLRLTLSEAAPGTSPNLSPNPSLFVTLARRAAEMRGLSVVRTGLRGVLDTKFGRFETVEATLSGAGTRHCTGFASLDARAMRIDGWLCGLLGQAPVPRALACALDGLTLTGGAVPTIEVAFGEAALRRLPGCGAHGTDATGSIAGEKTGDKSRSGPRPSRLTKK